MPSRRLIRLAAALLLVLIAADLAAIHTCAFDTDRAPARANASVSAPAGSGTTTQHHSPLHPDHCFCHGVSVGADHALLAEPCLEAGDVPENPAAYVLQTSVALYHPPQLLS